MGFLGIDQSLNATGACRLSADGAVKSVVTISPGKEIGARRLVLVKQAVASMTEGVSLAALEGYSYGSVGQVFELGEIGGVLKVMLHELHIPFIIVAPVLLKKWATGNTGASKEDMLSAAQSRGLKTDDDNQADAFFLAHIARAYELNTAKYRCEMEVIHALRNPAQKKPQRRIRRLVKAAL